MKIAAIASVQIPSRRANSIQVMKMTHALGSLGHQVCLLVPDSGREQRQQPRSAERSDLIAIHDITWQEINHHYGLSGADSESQPAVWRPLFKIIPLASNLRFHYYDFCLQALRWARAWGAEIIYTRLPQAAGAGSQLGLPMIFEAHDLPQGKMGPWLFYRFLNGKGARRLVVITASLARQLNQEYGAPLPDDQAGAFTLVAPDGVDLHRYQDLPSPQSARAVIKPPLPERFTAGYTGHLYSGRGIQLLLNLAKILPELNFLIAGGEPGDVSRLQDQARNLQLDNLVITGFIPNSVLPRYQAACEALLMPYQEHVSASSGGDIGRYLSPMKVFEYMACGRPIISSNLPVLYEVLNGNNAILLPSDDVDAWAAALLELQSNPALGKRLASQARSDAQKYSWENRALRVLQGLELNQHNLTGSPHSIKGPNDVPG